MLGRRGRHYLSNFLEMPRISCRKKFRNGAQKKVPESAGLAGRSGPRLGSPSHVLAQTRFPSRAKNIKNGPKWVQNRRFGLKIGPRESYGRFGPVRTGPGPKKSKSMPKNHQGGVAHCQKRATVTPTSSFPTVGRPIWQTLKHSLESSSTRTAHYRERVREQ